MTLNFDLENQIWKKTNIGKDSIDLKYVAEAMVEYGNDIYPKKTSNRNLADFAKRKVSTFDMLSEEDEVMLDKVEILVTTLWNLIWHFITSKAASTILN